MPRTFRKGRTCMSAALQRALNDESANQVSINFFGDGTANNGAPYTLTMPANSLFGPRGGPDVDAHSSSNHAHPEVLM